MFSVSVVVARDRSSWRRYGKIGAGERDILHAVKMEGERGDSLNRAIRSTAFGLSLFLPNPFSFFSDEITIRPDTE
jgi:hypothetical protein